MNRIQARIGEERGFTLIELLVVMIIIGILMSVAVPVFLTQKQKSLASNAKSNAQNTFTTIESCAASTSNGTLVDGSGANQYDCRDVGNILDNEPSLDKLLNGTNCGGQVCVRVTAGATASTYTITSVTNTGDADLRTTFSIDRTDTGVTKNCAGGLHQAGSDPNSNSGVKKTCPTGTWG